MPQNQRPNILWVSFEDTSPYYGCYGDKVARTPNLDRLAAEGCRWPNAFSTAGVCAPARSAIITGMYPISIGTHHMRTTHANRATPEMPTPYSAVVPHYVKCFSEYLRAAGYYCTNNVKTDYQFDPPCTAWDELSSEAHWRNRPDPDQPFFAVFNPTRTHESGMWTERTEIDASIDLDAIEVPPYLPDTPKVREAMGRMYTNIHRSDAELGQLLEELEEDGLAENTILFHWSDHGPLPRGKRWPYDAGIHVPMIVRWPGQLAPGAVSEQLISTIDLGPTVLSLTGVAIPAHMQGRAFLGEASAPPREYIYASRDRFDESYDMIRAVRDSRFKYIRNMRPELPYLLWIPYRNRHPITQEMWRLHMTGQLDDAQSLMFRTNRPVEELYDTETDPHEIHNLAGEAAFAGVLDRMRGALDEWVDRVGDMGRVSELEMVRRWYPDGEQPRTAPVVFVPICAEHLGTETALEGGDFSGPLLLQMHCATQGASIAYTFDEGDGARWRLYTGPLQIPPGSAQVRARATRIGYAASVERAAAFRVSAS